MKKFYSLLLLAMAALTPAHAQWNTNATPVCIYSTTYVDENGETKTGGDYFACSPLVARTPDKKTWISWKTWGHKYIGDVRVSAVRTYLQLLDRDGVPQFEEPILVNDHITPTWWSKYALCVASDGSAIVTVSDSRTEDESYAGDSNSSPQTFTPAIYKIDQEGNFLWGLDGIEFTDQTNSPFTNAYVVGDDTFFLFIVQADMDEDTSADGIYMIRIDDDGTLGWDEPKKMASGVTTKGQILPSTNGEFLYFDDTPDGARVRRFDRDLNEVWGEPLIYDDYYYTGYEMNHYRLTPDGEGGACVAFLRVMGQFSHNIRVQHINGDGSLGFGLTGLDAYNAEEYDHNYPSIAANPETGQIFVMFASQLAGTGNVMSQLFTFDGDYLFDEKGLSLASKDANTNAYFYGLRGCGATPDGDWITVFTDISAHSRSSIIIRRYKSDGTRVWTRTIGRDIDPTDMNVVVEKEATYLFYREYREGKNPGINIFRIGHDGGYNVEYAEEDAITSVEEKVSGSAGFFTIDGKHLSAPQQGLNIVRRADGTVSKHIVK